MKSTSSHKACPARDLHNTRSTGSQWLTRYSPSFSNLPVFGVLPAGSTGSVKTKVYNLPGSRSSHVMLVGRFLTWVGVSTLHSSSTSALPQRVLRPLVNFLQAQRPGPLAEVQWHRGVQRVRQQGKWLVDSRRVGARIHSSLQTGQRRSACTRATAPAHHTPRHQRGGAPLCSLIGPAR